MQADPTDWRPSMAELERRGARGLTSREGAELEHTRHNYRARSARDAEAVGYGARGYWDYLEAHALELREYYRRRGQAALAASMLTRTLSESLQGNDSA